MAFILLGCNGLSLLHFANAGVHALGHLFIRGALGLGNVQELELQFANLIGRTTLDSTSLASLALDTVDFFTCPFVVARYIDGEWTSIALLLMIRKTDVSASKASITSNQVVDEIPCRRLLGLGILF